MCPWWFGVLGDYTTQLCGDCNFKPLKGSQDQTTSVVESKSFFLWLNYHRLPSLLHQLYCLLAYPRLSMYGMFTYIECWGIHIRLAIMAQKMRVSALLRHMFEGNIVLSLIPGVVEVHWLSQFINHPQHSLPSYHTCILPGFSQNVVYVFVTFFHAAQVTDQLQVLPSHRINALYSFEVHYLVDINWDHISPAFDIGRPRGPLDPERSALKKHTNNLDHLISYRLEKLKQF